MHRLPVWVLAMKALLLALLLALAPPLFKWTDERGMQHEITGSSTGQLVHVVWDPETQLGHWHYVE